MDYQRFIRHLPELYETSEKQTLSPKSPLFQSVVEKLQEQSTANIMQLLNLAVDCLEEDENYCEVGCRSGANLIGALLNHQHVTAYAIDDFSPDEVETKIEKLINNLSLFDLADQVIFSNESLEEFFFEFREIEAEPKIGVYFYAGAKDYRFQLLGLLLVKPFLAEQALIIVSGSNYSTVQQAHWDFLATTPQSQLLLNLPGNQEVNGRFGDGLHIFNWDVNQSISYDWSQFNKKFRNQPLITAIEQFYSEFEFKTKREALEKFTKEAVLLEFNYKTLLAEKKYQEVLEWDIYNPYSYHNIGMFYYSQERYKDALSLLNKAKEIDPSLDSTHYSLGLVLEKLRLTIPAIEAYQKAIAINPKLADAYNNLGNLFIQINKLTNAEEIYQQAVATNPNHFGGYLNLGNVLMSLERVDEAIEAYEKALSLKPRNADIINNLASAFAANNQPDKSQLYLGYAAYRQGKYQEAINYWGNYLEAENQDVNFYVDLAECYIQTNQYELAVKTSEECIIRYPTEVLPHLTLILLMQSLNRTEEAIEIAQQAVEMFPNNFSVKLEELRLMPILYTDLGEIETYRNRFIHKLNDFINQVSLDTEQQKKKAFEAISFNCNFFVQYQGKNDLQIQTKYGQFVHQVMAANYPEWVKSLPMPPLEPDERIRVGYISNCLHYHVVSHMFRGWFKKHNRNKFKIYSYAINVALDSKTLDFQVYSDVFHHIPRDLEAVCQQIISDKLHLLVFIDIGMYAMMNQIGSLRLAPIQCLAWGHPITSGLPTIDYFLSGELMEPENGEEHYSEKLIKLPNIGLYYDQLLIPEIRQERSHFKLNEDAVVYLSCQSLYKYLPQYDYVFAAIAHRVPQAQFAFIGSHISESITEKFRQRLQAAFASFGLNSEDYCVILPRLDGVEYPNLNLVSDVYLDTFSWSGGNTTMYAIATNLPIVTCPGEFMRGRHSYGMVRMLGVTETIAKDEAEYIEIAVRLGLDQDWRQSIVDKVKQNQNRAFEDPTCVVALEEFYQRVVQERLSSQSSY